ncbi:MAG: FAD-dependent oxidoreductase [Candidatus Lokiarchaeota archaeon]|nr:FAD-dependent oxidoreductase [Candidatus Lokiarchaeota archaeon]
MAETDVLVVGGGPAGLAAAIAAAREGVETLLVERYGCFGGVITQSMVGTLTWYRYAKTIDAGGIIKEFEFKAKEMDGTINNFSDKTRTTEIGNFLEKKGLLVDGIPTYEILDTEIFKVLADILLQEAGVTPLLHCQAVDSIMEGNMITGIVTESKSGRQAIIAKRVIDATGDADIAFHAGAPYRQDPKNKTMGVTVNFGCSGVDINKFITFLLEKMQKKPNFIPYLQQSGELFFMDDFTCFLEPLNKVDEGVIVPEKIPIKKIWPEYVELGIINSFNGIHIGNIDCTDVFDLTKAEIEGRSRLIKVLRSLRKHTPGFENARLKSIGSSLGTRESRKIIGEYNITEDDIKNQAQFKDSIGICPEFLDAYGIAIIPTTGRYFQIPYGIILPKKVENLLVAGRCVAGDKMSHGTTRQMVCCIATGQGAGVAAAVSIKENRTCREVDILEVQKSLENQGVRTK